MVCQICGRTNEPARQLDEAAATIAAPLSPVDAVTFAELAAFAGHNKLLSLALAGISVAIIVNEVSRLLGGVRQVGPAQLTALVNRDNALVVDLRIAGDFAKGHIAGSKNVQMSQFDPENKALVAAKSLPVVLVCNVGQTAAAAARRLRKAGFTHVAVLEGGIRSWQAADLPLVKGR